jgi:hypothetical protein
MTQRDRAIEMFRRVFDRWLRPALLVVLGGAG